MKARYGNGTTIKISAVNMEKIISNAYDPNTLETSLFVTGGCIVAFILIVVCLWFARRWVEIWYPSRRPNANNKMQQGADRNRHRVLQVPVVQEPIATVSKAIQPPSYEQHNFGVNKSTHAQYLPN